MVVVFLLELSKSILDTHEILVRATHVHENPAQQNSKNSPIHTGQTCLYMYSARASGEPRARCHASHVRRSCNDPVAEERNNSIETPSAFVGLNRCPINHIYVVRRHGTLPCAWGRARTNYSRSRFRFRFRWLPAFPLLIPQKMAVCCWLVCSLFLFALGLKTSLGEGGKYTIKQSIHYAGPFLSFII